MSRWLQRLLILSLLPVVVVYGGQVRADADTYSGAVENVKVGDIGLKGSTGWECNLSAWFVTTAPTTTTYDAYVKGEYSCKTGWYQDDTRLYAMRFENSTNGCRYEYSFDGLNIDETANREGTFVAPRYTVGTLPMCGPVTSVCIHYKVDDPFGSSDYKWKCADFPLGEPPTPVNDDGDEPCPYGRPAASFITLDDPHEYEYLISGNFRYSRMEQVFHVKMRGPVAGGPITGGSWWLYVVYRGQNTNVGTDPTTLGNVSNMTNGGGTTIYDGTAPYIAYTAMGAYPSGGLGEWRGSLIVSNTQAVDTTNGNKSGSLNVNRDIIGIGVSWMRSANPTITNTPPVTAPVTPGEYDNKAVGWNDSYGCSFYQGTKVAQSADTAVTTDDPPAIDTPRGVEPTPEPDPVTVPPGDQVDPPPDQTEDDACGDFSLWNPTTWAQAGICVLVQAILEAVKVLGHILDAIVGLADAILSGLADLLAGLVDAIGALLEALFVPDGDALKANIDSLKAVFDDSPAGDWTDAFTTGMGGSAGGGCAGPTFDLPPIMGEDLPTIQPFDACGSASSAAATVRAVLVVGISLSGGFMILRMVLTSLGIRTPSPMQGGKE